MKKLLYCLTLALLIPFASCTKETTYTFINNADFSVITLPMVNQTFHLIEYDQSGSRIADNTIDFPATGKGYTFTANDRSEKIKVYYSIRYQDDNQTVDYSRWVQIVYYLEKGKDITIQIDESTLVGTAEPQ